MALLGVEFRKHLVDKLLVNDMRGETPCTHSLLSMLAHGSLGIRQVSDS